MLAWVCLRSWNLSASGIKFSLSLGGGGGAFAFGLPPVRSRGSLILSRTALSARLTLPRKTWPPDFVQNTGAEQARLLVPLPVGQHGGDAGPRNHHRSPARRRLRLLDRESISLRPGQRPPHGQGASVDVFP